jgi:hypothetical protein
VRITKIKIPHFLGAHGARTCSAVDCRSFSLFPISTSASYLALQVHPTTTSTTTTTFSLHACNVFTLPKDTQGCLATNVVSRDAIYSALKLLHATVGMRPPSVLRVSGNNKGLSSNHCVASGDPELFQLPETTAGLR